MLRTLIRKEILNNLLNLRFALAYFLCTFLLVGSAAIMFADYVAQKKIDDLNKNMYAEQTHQAQNIFDFLWSSKNVARETVMTRFLALGAEKDADQRASITASSSPYFYGDFKRNPLGNLFPSVDMLFVVGIIISLLIFVLTYDMVSGEREEGTLRVLLCCPVPRDKILAAKWIGGFLSLAVPYVTSVLIIMLMLVLNGEIRVSLQEWGRILSIFGVCILYLAVVFSLSMMVSVLFATSSTVILTLLLSWVVLFVAVPALSTPLAYLLVCKDGVYENEVAMKKYGIVGLNGLFERLESFVTMKLGNRAPNQITPAEGQQVDSISVYSQVDIPAIALDSVIQEGEKSFNEVRRIENLGQWIARLSPLGCLQNSCVLLAGTGINREAVLRASTEEYARTCISYISTYAPPEKRNQFSGLQVPSYRQHQARFSDDLAGALPDIAILFLMGTFFSLMALVRFLKIEAV